MLIWGFSIYIQCFRLEECQNRLRGSKCEEDKLIMSYIKSYSNIVSGFTFYYIDIYDISMVWSFLNFLSINQYLLNHILKKSVNIIHVTSQTDQLYAYLNLTMI